MSALDEPNVWRPVRGWHGPDDRDRLMQMLRNVTAAGKTDPERARWFRGTRAYRTMPRDLRAAFDKKWSD